VPDEQDIALAALIVANWPEGMVVSSSATPASGAGGAAARGATTAREAKAAIKGMNFMQISSRHWGD
jgi:hypothetical protein